MATHHFVFDLETTGLPITRRVPGKSRYYSYKCIDKYSASRIVSVAWIVLDEALNEKERRYYVVKPKGYSIPLEATRIHGISQEEAMATGEDLPWVLSQLSETITSCGTVVSHNLGFDLSILLSELYRVRMCSTVNHIFSMKRYCTMKEGMKHLELNKYPKLVDLYTTFFPEKPPMPNAHNALHDTLHASECYRHLLHQCTSGARQSSPGSPR